MSTDAVIDCWWLNNKLECHDKPGFKSSKTVGANMTVTIREVTSEVTGTYACQVDGYGPKSPGACELKFELGDFLCPQIIKFILILLPKLFSNKMIVELDLYKDFFYLHVAYLT